MDLDKIHLNLIEVIAAFVAIISAIVVPMGLYIWRQIVKEIKDNKENLRLLKTKVEDQEKFIEKHVPTFEQSSAMAKKRIRRAFQIHDTKHHKSSKPTFPNPEEDL